MSDEDVLRDLQVAIIEAENRGDRDWLAGVIDSQLAMQRAKQGTPPTNRDGFLSGVGPDGDRVSESVGPIHVHGSRAVVECVVRSGGRRIHNLRLFVKRDDAWRLLAWANEFLPNA
jgi:hypothetical protein